MSPSPTAFKSLLQSLLSHLHTCNNHILAIRVERHLSRHTHALDALQSSLRLSVTNIERSFASWHQIIGSRMDLGDDTARNTLGTAIRDVQLIEANLKDLGSHTVTSGGRERPGFGDMRKRWEEIRVRIEGAIEGCGRRFERPSPPSSTPYPQRPSGPETYPPPPPHHYQSQRPPQDEIRVSATQLAAYREQMRNSWVEHRLPGRRSEWVNVFDDSIVVDERPDGFVKMAPVDRERRRYSATVEDYEESEASWSGSRSRY